MKSMIIVALAFVVVAVALPVEDKDASTILEAFDIKPDGTYELVVETNNGIKQQAQGVLRQGVDEENKPRTFLAVQGSYSYPNPDGSINTINYSADETGYHAEGDSVPKAPQI